ncbi:Tetraspanin-15-like protein, partial [Leptotrombidium deliense]
MGSYKRGGCMIRMVSNAVRFLVLCVLTIAAEIGGIISLSILRAKVTDIVDQSWKELNQRTRNLIQQQFECCGLHGPSEYAHKSDPIDSSCYHSISGENFVNNATEYGKSINDKGCKDVVTSWIFQHKITWVAAFGGFLLFQVITVLLSVSAVNHLKRRSSSVASLEERTYM